MKIDLGVTVKDIITGFEGVVTGRCEYITGCNQYLLQPKVKADGTKQDGQWVDEQRLELIAGVDRIVIDNSASQGADMAAPIK